jgi:hypothetical protein
MKARLLRLWMVWTLLAPLLPTASAFASGPRHVHMACCPIRPVRDGLCADHVCTGWLVATNVAPAAVPPARSSVAPTIIEPRPLAEYRLAFDPPPPRTVD